MISVMSKITRPKPLSSLLSSVDSNSGEQFLQLLSKYKVTDKKGRYLHWDKFKWRVERGDEAELAWLATKISRRAISKSLTTLQAENGSCFAYCIPNSLQAQLHLIDTMVGGGYSLSNNSFLVSTEAEKNQYLVKNLIMEEAITSAQLEGASTTRKVAKEILEKNIAPKDKSQQMIVNNFLLMKQVLTLKDSPLNVDTILELHRIATFKAIDNHANPGELRQTNDIYVGDIYGDSFFQPPAFNTIEQRLEELCDFANQSHDQLDRDNFIHPIIKAIMLHFLIGYIHPFGDGNGRTARALFYWSILRSGYWLFEYVSISRIIQEKRSSYDAAFIYTETDDFDLTYFIYNQVEVIIKAISALNSYIERKKKELFDFVSWIEKSPIAKKLKRGHLEILKVAIQEPGKEFAAQQVANEVGVSLNTARTYLKKLVEEDLLVSANTKKTRQLRYLAPNNLKQRLYLDN